MSKRLSFANKIVLCDKCGKIFARNVTEVKKSELLGRKIFCSQKCVYEFNRVDGDIPKLKEYIRRIRRRNQPTDLDLSDLEILWYKQKEICPYTGIKLTLADSTIKNDPIYTASLDRIDSEKGYIKGNVQFVSTAINYMKHDMTHEKTIELCKLIGKNHLEL